MKVQKIFYLLFASDFLEEKEVRDVREQGVRHKRKGTLFVMDFPAHDKSLTACVFVCIYAPCFSALGINWEKPCEAGTSGLN